MTPERWQEIKRLYESALNRNERERAAFLEEARLRQFRVQGWARVG